MTAPAPNSRAICRPNPWPWRALVVCLPATVWGSSACDRDGSGGGVPASASPSTATSTTTQAATRSFAKPFMGVIRVREMIAGIHVADIEYTIDAQRIRREKTYVVPQKLGAPRRVGVIIDLTKGRAIRYETVNNKRYFLEQSIEQYDASLDDT